MKKTLSTSALALLSTTLFLGLANAQTPDAQMPEAQTTEAPTPEAQAPEAQAPEAPTPETQAPETQAPEAQAPEAPMTDTNGNGAMAKDSKTTGRMEKSMMTSDADKKYLMEAAQGSVYDSATAELAVQKAQSKSVQKYALRLMDDHTRLNKLLFVQANKRGIVLPLQMTSEDGDKLQVLVTQNAGDSFDVAYLREAIRINTEDVIKGNAASKASEDSQFKSLMYDYVVTEQKHLDMASRILSEIDRASGAMNKNIMGAPAVKKDAAKTN